MGTYRTKLRRLGEDEVAGAAVINPIIDFLENIRSNTIGLEIYPNADGGLTIDLDPVVVATARYNHGPSSSSSSSSSSGSSSSSSSSSGSSSSSSSSSSSVQIPVAIEITGDVAWNGLYLLQDTQWKDGPWYAGPNYILFWWGDDAPFALPGSPCYVVSPPGQTTPAYGATPYDLMTGNTGLPYGTLYSGAVATPQYASSSETPSSSSSSEESSSSGGGGGGYPIYPSSSSSGSSFTPPGAIAVTVPDDTYGASGTYTFHGYSSSGLPRYVKLISGVSYRFELYYDDQWLGPAQPGGVGRYILIDTVQSDPVVIDFKGADDSPTSPLGTYYNGTTATQPAQEV